MDNQNLPLELLRPIIEHLNDDLPSLLAVSLVSSALRVEGQRLLFRTVAHSENVEAHIKFLSAVTSSTLLGHFVKEYHQVDLLDAEHKQEPLWGLTCRGLQAMVNLKVLLFRALNGHPSAQILKECTFRLEVLKWECRDDAEQLYGFFLTQPNLRILKVEWNGPELNTSGISPELQVLHGNRGTMNAFFPRRGITTLKWSPDREESPLLNGSIHHLSQEFHHIQIFSFGGPFGRPWLNIVIPYFRALEVLELIGLNFHEELQWLSDIPRLRVFILSNPTHRGWRGLLSLKSREDYFPELFTACKLLQHIDINTTARTYQRWFRDGSQNIYIFKVDEVLLPCWNIS